MITPIRNMTWSALIAMMLPAFTATATASAASKVLDRIVAVVNEDIILLSELKARMMPYTQRIHQQGFDAEKERQMIFKVREEMINRLVDEKLTDQEITRKDIQVDEAEIDKTIERIKQTNYFTDEDLRRFLEEEQMTLAEYRDSVKEQILRTRLVNYEVKSRIVITEEEIRAYYEKHRDLYGGKVSYHLRNILMRVPDYATSSEKQAVGEKMRRLRSQIEQGADFAELARDYSQGPSAADGGDIGAFDRESLSPQILAALDNLESGQTTAVLDTDQGFQLFYLQAKSRGEGKPLASVRAEIHHKLYEEVVNKKFLSWLEDLRSQSHIKIIN